MVRCGDIFAVSGLPILLEHQGETVTYRPRNGAPRAILALVDRSPPTQFEDVIQALAPRVALRVLNDDRQGIASSEIDTGGDEVDVAVRSGGAVTTRPIVQLLNHDDSMLEVETR